MQIISKAGLLALFITCLFTFSNAQIRVIDKNTLGKIQNGYTHVIVGNAQFPRADEYLSVFKKYWTVTKGVDFITSDNVVGNMVAGDSYFSFEMVQVTGERGGVSLYLYLNLWQPTKKALHDKKFKMTHENALAHIELSANGSILMNVSNRNLNINLDGGDYIFHWNPGLLKNYLQLLTAYLKAGKRININDDVTDKTQLKALQNQTLYVAEDELGIYSSRINFLLTINMIIGCYQIESSVMTL